MNTRIERLAGANLDGTAKIKPAPPKEMTAAEIAEFNKLLMVTDDFLLT